MQVCDRGNKWHMFGYEAAWTAQSFAYEIKGDSAVILRCFSRDSKVEIPERIDGHLVTEIGDYAFSEHFEEEKLEEIVLPSSVRRVGRYCFYNCGNLHRIEFYGSLSDWGSGAFTGCHGVRSLRVHADAEGRSHLKDVLDELREELEVEYFTEPPAGDQSAKDSGGTADERVTTGHQEGAVAGNQSAKDSGGTADERVMMEHQKGAVPGSRAAEYSGSIADERRNGGHGFALLIFPEFYEEGVENTPARILENHVHGSGILYRNCFRGRVLDFAQYDALFPHARAWESRELVLRMALARLRAPQGLTQMAREQYEAYLAEHAAEAGSWLLGQRDLDGLRFLLAFVRSREDDGKRECSQGSVRRKGRLTDESNRPESRKNDMDTGGYEKAVLEDCANETKGTAGDRLERSLLEGASRMQYLEAVSFLMEYERANRRENHSRRQRFEL